MDQVEIDEILERFERRRELRRGSRTFTVRPSWHDPELSDFELRGGTDAEERARTVWPNPKYL